MKDPLRTIKFTAALPLVAALLLSACGNLNARPPLTAPADSYQSRPASAATSPLTTEDGYSCPEKANVIPDYDWSFNGSGFYSVCQNRERRSDILIHGTTRASNTICIFPAQVVDDEHIYTKPDLTTGAPLAQCVQVAADGVYATFANMNFNAVFIVEKPDLAQMRSCLIGGNYYACPAYSFGQFR